MIPKIFVQLLLTVNSLLNSIQVSRRFEYCKTGPSIVSGFLLNLLIFVYSRNLKTGSSTKPSNHSPTFEELVVALGLISLHLNRNPKCHCSSLHLSILGISVLYIFYYINPFRFIYLYPISLKLIMLFEYFDVLLLFSFFNHLAESKSTFLRDSSLDRDA